MGGGREMLCGSEGRCTLFERLGNLGLETVFELLGCESTALRPMGFLTGK